MNGCFPARNPRPIACRAQLLAALLLLFASTWPLAAGEQVFASELQRFRLRIVSDGLEHPWGLAFLPDGRACG